MRSAVGIRRTAALLFLSLFVIGCARETDEITITVWHQMTVGERVVLMDQIKRFESENPGTRVDAPYKETEELRSGFQAAALAGTGPELVFGPSDTLGTFVTMGIVQDMQPWFDRTHQGDFLDQSLTFLSPPQSDERWLVQIGDRVGNHLALVYNRNLIPDPPATTRELVKIAVEATRDTSTGKQYGLVWNFVEPFFLIPFVTGYGGWVFEEGSTNPNLNTPEVTEALGFVADLQNKYQVLPANCDYETADSLFKDGSAAMIINGDWSWSQYLENESIDAVVAPLPVVSSTGLPMGPMVATKGYSLNVHATGEQADAAMHFVHFMTSEKTQREFATRLKTLPSRKSLLDDPLLTEDPTLVASAQQMKNGHTMPVVPELRAIWDGMRPSYQQLLGGGVTPAQAAEQMQSDAVKKIAVMNQDNQASAMGVVLQLVGLGIFVALLLWQRKHWAQLMIDLRQNTFAYILIFPAMLVIALTIVYPFVYNIVLSFSNMSLRNFRDWQITGFQNYVQVLSEWVFFSVLIKTIIWTVVCVLFHLTIGLLLAVCLNKPVRISYFSLVFGLICGSLAKLMMAGNDPDEYLFAILIGIGFAFLGGFIVDLIGFDSENRFGFDIRTSYRIILILPWAIPSYITALTWRGMFNFDYGAINLMLTQWLGFSEGLNWLGDEFLALSACIITNIWLGFPFMMIIALGGMQGIPAEMYEAARIDRVSRWKQFWHITLPMLKPVLIPATTLGAIWTFNNLNVVWLVTNAGEPADKTHILVSYVYKAVFNLYQYGYGAALSMIIFFLLLAFSLAFLGRTQATEGIT